MLLPITECGPVSIIGNGPGDSPEVLFGSPHVTFNRPPTSNLQTGEISISNRKVSETSCTNSLLTVVSKSFSVGFCLELQNALSDIALDLRMSLGCYPSAGTTIFIALSSLQIPLHVFKMTLCPGLERPNTLPLRKPLPSAFHNWLGERRIVLECWRESSTYCHWPQLYLSTDPVKFFIKDLTNPYTSLMEWFLKHEGGNPFDAETATLQRLIDLPLSAWQLNANLNVLIELERFFFLSRDELLTPNWWLYCNNTSKLMNAIQLRLMQVQQTLIY